MMGDFSAQRKTVKREETAFSNWPVPELGFFSPRRRELGRAHYLSIIAIPKYSVVGRPNVTIQWPVVNVNEQLTVSLPRVINIKCPLQLRRNITSHSMKNLAFHS